MSTEFEFDDIDFLNVLPPEEYIFIAPLSW